ncbi:hypothetical protein Hanom_Chr17g01525821 [Helianthus anomalus]
MAHWLQQLCHFCIFMTSFWLKNWQYLFLFYTIPKSEVFFYNKIKIYTTF